MKKAKIGSYLVVCGADYFKSYIGNIGTIITIKVLWAEWKRTEKEWKRLDNEGEKK